MDTIIYDGMQIIFGSQNDALEKFMEGMLDALKSVFNNGLVSNAIDIFGAVCASLLIMYWLIEIIGLATRDMMSLEKMVVGFMKYIVAVVIVLNLSTIMSNLVGLADGFFEMCRDFPMTDVSVSAFETDADGNPGTEPEFGPEIVGGSEFLTWSKAEAEDNANLDSDGNHQDGYLRKNFEDEYSGIFGFFRGVGIAFKMFLPALIHAAVYLVGCFICISTSLQIIVRGIASPLGIVSLFEEGTRSSGVRYLKKFAALCFTFSVMILVITAVGHLGQAIRMFNWNYGWGGLYKSIATFDELSQAITFKDAIIGCLPSIAGIGAMIGANRLADEVFGV